MRTIWLCIVSCMLVATVQAARIQDARPLMGTVVEVVVEGAEEPALRAALENAYLEMRRLSDMMNHYDPASAVSAVNAAAGLRPVAVPPELMQVLAEASRLSGRTRGAFDVTIASLRGWSFRPGNPRLPEAAEIARQLPLVNWRGLVLDQKAHTAYLHRAGMRIDLGGIAKIPILEAGRRSLERAGVLRALVNGGGDVVAHSDGQPWRVGVRDPRAPHRLLGVLPLVRGCVASSGDYERYFEREGRRYHHILDPRTGYPAQGTRGVTLVAPVAEAVNGLGVAVMVLGSESSRRLIEGSPGVDALIVDRDGSIWMSDGMRARLEEATTR